MQGNSSAAACCSIIFKYNTGIIGDVKMEETIIIMNI